ncbi:MAG: putative metal-binding motif-containing protein [Sandaracinaceae bacterium]|nr:putative metal-binding motif-containing protein [Sandaracinaceae bacterium]
MWQRAVQLVTLGACASAVVMSACDGPAATSDAGLDGGARFDAARDAGATCAADESCDDGLFCNGAERCAPGAAGADARGCAPAADTTPCDDTEVCDEASDACEADDCEDPDADRDGHDRVACGGDDCDDESATRFPGNTEICDALNVDEDCDPRTFGVRDLDGDGETDALCCNVAGDGTMRCGPDCDDARASTHTAGAEVCNGRDDDCDGTVDDGALLTFYPDADRDGRGDASGTPVSGCTPPEGYALLADDCDDTSAARFPGNAETCDAAGVDEDCDGEANPISLCTCSEGETRPCARAGACAAGTESCTLSGTWGACSIDPVPEVCNGADDDCDGLADDGVSIICYADGDNDGYAEIGGRRRPPVPHGGARRRRRVPAVHHEPRSFGGPGLQRRELRRSPGRRRGVQRRRRRLRLDDRRGRAGDVLRRLRRRWSGHQRGERSDLVRQAAHRRGVPGLPSDRLLDQQHGLP